VIQQSRRRNTVEIEGTRCAIEIPDELLAVDVELHGLATLDIYETGIRADLDDAVHGGGRAGVAHELLFIMFSNKRKGWCRRSSCEDGIDTLHEEGLTTGWRLINHC
jgi:hypothetical protein